MEFSPWDFLKTLSWPARVAVVLVVLAALGVAVVVVIEDVHELSGQTPVALHFLAGYAAAAVFAIVVVDRGIADWRRKRSG